MKSLLAFLVLAFSASLPAQSIKLGATAGGIVVDGGVHGRVVLGAPTLTGSDKKPRAATTFTPSADGASAKATYADGTAVTIATSSADGSILYRFDSVPADVIALVITTELPLDYNNGGTWRANGGEAKPFPGEPGKQLFAQGAFTRIDFHTGSGEGLSFITPASYQQLQDPRVWGIQHFQWIYHYDFLRYPGAASFTLKVAAVPAK